MTNFVWTKINGRTGSTRDPNGPSVGYASCGDKMAFGVVLSCAVMCRNVTPTLHDGVASVSCVTKKTLRFCLRTCDDGDPQYWEPSGKRPPYTGC